MARIKNETPTATVGDASTVGFGFQPHESQHHFLVLIPRATTQPVQISEHYSFDRDGSSDPHFGTNPDGQIRVLLPRSKWDAIADEVRAQFNLRLRKQLEPSGAWRVGRTLVRRDLGKELTLLAWALEDADPALAKNGVANWSGLEPEERWWLYSQAAASTGFARDNNKGWRKAVRFALTENPVLMRDSGRAVPDFYRQAEAQSALFSRERD